MCADPMRPRAIPRRSSDAFSRCGRGRLRSPCANAILCSSTTLPEAHRSGSTASSIEVPSEKKRRSFSHDDTRKSALDPSPAAPRVCLFSSALLRVTATVFAGRTGLFSSTEKPPPRRLITMPKAVPCRHGMGVSPSSPASSSSCNRIPIRSTAVISGQSASAKLSASRTLCGRGIQANETRDSASATRRSEE